MGGYLNPGNERFQINLNGKIYVDKTDLIGYTNSVLCTPQRFVCVSRPRRFGKSVAADMLVAYYSRGCDSRKLFQGLKIARNESFEEHLNQYHVISLNMQEFLSRSKNIEDMLRRINRLVMRELIREYPDVNYFDAEDLIQSMQDIYVEKRCRFVIVVDEWDCIFREFRKDTDAQNVYLDFMRDFLKDREYINLAYMTGILPIKKYGTHSALNMFTEFSMTSAKQLAWFAGFDDREVEELCTRFGRNLDEMKLWYDGYYLNRTISVYNPKSVVEAVLSGVCDTYWNQTETFEALRGYIDMNFDGLRDDIIRMMSGERVQINIGNFSNDMVTFCTKDDVLTLLVHLGYLGYDYDNESVFIPNHEVRREFYNAVSVSDWQEVTKALLNSNAMLDAIWEKNTEQVAQCMEQAHFETSQIQYNDENALSCTISLALYTARQFYSVIRECPSGKGFADIVYIPRKKYQDKPALVVELKWDKSAKGAIAQIKERQYGNALEEYKGNIFLVGVNYDKGTKKHSCVIEEASQ